MFIYDARPEPRAFPDVDVKDLLLRLCRAATAGKIAAPLLRIEMIHAVDCPRRGEGQPLFGVAPRGCECMGAAIVRDITFPGGMPETPDGPRQPINALVA